MADIKLVINISEESYKNIKEQVDKRDYPDMQIGRAIADGKPLPKGHGDIIDRNKIEYMKAIHDLKWGKITAIECAIKIIYSAPTIIEKEQRNMSCMLDEYEPYWCESDLNCKDCPNWVEDKEVENENDD